TTVIVVKTRQQVGLATFEELRGEEGSLPEADAYIERSRSLTTVVDRWFAENTFHASEFSDIRKLVSLKEKAGLTVSVGLPALNEEKTIGLVIKRIRGALMERAPLIDQLVVIDSDSTDRTREIAGELDVPVIRHGDRVMPEGGGRVTELMARPLINLFFPELSGLVQPLAGEYAGRRELLESVPFFSGYAVEVGLLVDILDQAGLSAIGQVDLE